MEVVYNSKKSGLDISKKIYECSNCGKLFNWGVNSSWYGSYLQLENNPKDIKIACSDKCRKSIINELTKQQ